ncbi:MAG: RNA 2',3'-cyclic phosphodiesterase [Pyrobaculum sp.]
MSLVRIFVAIDVEDVDVVKKIEGVQQEALRLGLDIKLVERENLHFTLRFLGEIPQSRVNDVVKTLSMLRFNKFQLGLAGIGVFPDLSRPRVLWVGVSQGVEEIKKVAKAIRESVDRYAAHVEKEEFVPHLTIGRIKSGRNIERVRDLVSRHREISFGVIEVDKVKLKKSVLTPRGPIYSDLFVLSLT